MSTSAEDTGREFLFALMELKEEIDKHNKLIESTVEVYKHQGPNCNAAHTGLRIFWVKNRLEIIKLINKLSEIAKNLPGDTALDNDTFSYELGRKAFLDG